MLNRFFFLIRQYKKTIIEKVHFLRVFMQFTQKVKILLNSCVPPFCEQFRGTGDKKAQCFNLLLYIESFAGFRKCWNIFFSNILRRRYK